MPGVDDIFEKIGKLADMFFNKGWLGYAIAGLVILGLYFLFFK